MPVDTEGFVIKDVQPDSETVAFDDELEFFVADPRIEGSHASKLKKVKGEGVKNAASGRRTPEEVRDALASLTGSNRLDQSAIKNLPTGGGGSGGGGLASVASDATLSGDGTGNDPLRVARPFTAADESKLDGIDPSEYATSAALAAQVDLLTNTRSELEGVTNAASTNETNIDAVGDPRRVDVANANEYTTALDDQLASNRPLVLVFTVDVTGAFTHPVSGATESFAYGAGDVYWVPPRTVTPRDFLTLPQATSGGEGVDTAARTRLTAIEADDWVTTRRYADQSIETNHILWGSLIGRHFRTIANGGGIGGGLIVNNALEDRHFPNDIISSRMIPADAVGNSELQADSVGAEEVINGSLTEVTLAAAVRAKLNASRGSDPVILVEDPASPETATADNFNKLLWRGDRLYYNSRSRTDGTNVGWGPMTTPLLVQHVGAGLAWQGAHQINPQESRWPWAT